MKEEAVPGLNGREMYQQKGLKREKKQLTYILRILQAHHAYRFPNLVCGVVIMALAGCH